LQDLYKPDTILHDDGLIQAIFFAQNLSVFLIVGITKQGDDRIARDSLHHRKNDQGNRQDGWNNLQNALDDVFPHRSTSTALAMAVIHRHGQCLVNDLLV
jgi:hypothetical protein